MNEENGLRGGTGYAKDHAAELVNHIGAMETDGGAGHPVGINFAGKPEIEKILEPVAQVLSEIGAGILNKSEHTGADITPMQKEGAVPTFSPMQDSRTYFHYHHTAADTLDKVIPRELAENAAVNAVFAYAIANAEQPLPR
jgi:hypothetical protein